MAADKAIKDILQTIDKAIVDFQKGIPAIQSGVLDAVLLQLKDLETNNGRILNSVQNLKLMLRIKNNLERLIISEGYKKQVKEFIDTFNAVESLNQQYFAAFNQKFTPNKTLPIIREAAVGKTLNDLLGQGLQSNIVDPVGDILNQNITTGGSYNSLNEQLRNAILTNGTGEGGLERYTKTITTDALNQYSAQYHDVLAQDLKFNWGRYVGSNMRTTREFCEFLTKKQWVHRSELPRILEGIIDGHQCKVNKQKLPLGMIPGTTVDNFKIRRGGYNCGHQFFWVPDNAVPENIKAMLGKKPEPVPAALPVPTLTGKPAGVPVSSHFNQIDASIQKQVTTSLSSIDNVHGDGKLENIPIQKVSRGSAQGTFYRTYFGQPLKITLNSKATSPELTFAHEMGHYLDLHAIGKPGRMESDYPDAINKSVIDALKQTPTIKNIQSILSKGLLTIDGKTIKVSSAYKSHLRYLLEPREMFARAYAQFVAKRSGGVMEEQLKKRQAEDVKATVSYQFSDEEFNSIDLEFEKLFKDLGWISQ